MGFTSSRLTCKISIWICSYASYAANTEASKHVQRSRSLLRLKMAQFHTGHDQPPVRAQASSFRYTTHAMVTQISHEHRRSVKTWGDSGPTPLLYSWKSEESRWSWCSGGVGRGAGGWGWGGGGGRGVSPQFCWAAGNHGNKSVIVGGNKAQTKCALQCAPLWQWPAKHGRGGGDFT